MFEDMLREVVAEAVHAAVANLDVNEAFADGVRVCSRQEAADRLDCSLVTIDRLCRDRKLGYLEGVARGRVIPLAELQAYIERETVRPRR